MVAFLWDACDEWIGVDEAMEVSSIIPQWIGKSCSYEHENYAVKLRAKIYNNNNKSSYK